MESTANKTAATKIDSPTVGNLAQFPVARADRVADQVYRHLRQAILSEQISAGTRLRETEIAAALKVSRTPVREAISRLIGDWLVREIKHRRRRSDRRDGRNRRNLLHSRSFGIMRREACDRADHAEQLERLDGLVKEARTASFKERVRINQQFHLIIAEASGSPRLLDMIGGFREYFLNRRWISRQNSKMAKRAFEDHKKIVAALRSRSPDKVERVLRSHLKLGWEELIASAKAG